LKIFPFKVLDVTMNVDYIVSNYDLVISLHCQQIFPAKLVNNLRCVNIHPGFNPFNRGWYPQAFACINKLPCGITIHEMDEKIDHGAIIYQKETAVYPWDTSKEIYDRNLETERMLLKEHLEAIVSGEYTTSLPLQLGNYNSKKDYFDLQKLDLNTQGTFGEFIDYLRAISHGDYKNAYFVTPEGEKVFVKISLERDGQ
jgi:dTDP-4-amino-4,6-dideoxyglucose formyltransferase